MLNFDSDNEWEDESSTNYYQENNQDQLPISLQDDVLDDRSSYEDTDCSSGDDLNAIKSRIEICKEQLKKNVWFLQSKLQDHQNWSDVCSIAASKLSEVSQLLSPSSDECFEFQRDFTVTNCSCNCNGFQTSPSTQGAPGVCVTPLSQYFDSFAPSNSGNISLSTQIKCNGPLSIPVSGSDPNRTDMDTSFCPGDIRARFISNAVKEVAPNKYVLCDNILLQRKIPISSCVMDYGPDGALRAERRVSQETNTGSPQLFPTAVCTCTRPICQKTISDLQQALEECLYCPPKSMSENEVQCETQRSSASTAIDWPLTVSSCPCLDLDSEPVSETLSPMELKNEVQEKNELEPEEKVKKVKEEKEKTKKNGVPKPPKKRKTSRVQGQDSERKVKTKKVGVPKPPKKAKMRKVQTPVLEEKVVTKKGVVPKPPKKAKSRIVQTPVLEKKAITKKGGIPKPTKARKMRRAQTPISSTNTCCVLNSYTRNVHYCPIMKRSSLTKPPTSDCMYPYYCNWYNHTRSPYNCKSECYSLQGTGTKDADIVKASSPIVKNSGPGLGPKRIRGMAEQCRPPVTESRWSIWLPSPSVDNQRFFIKPHKTCCPRLTFCTF